MAVAGWSHSCNREARLYATRDNEAGNGMTHQVKNPEIGCRRRIQGRIGNPPTYRVAVIGESNTERIFIHENAQIYAWRTFEKEQLDCLGLQAFARKSVVLQDRKRLAVGSLTWRPSGRKGPPSRHIGSVETAFGNQASRGVPATCKQD